MNICIITFGYPPMIAGGVGTAVHRIAKNLVQAGVNVHVIAPGTLQIDDRMKPIQPILEEGVFVHRTFPSLKVYAGDPVELKAVGDYVIKLHKEINFDLLHGVFLIPAGMTAALIARQINLPLIVSIRGNDMEAMPYSPMFLESIRWVLKQASLVTSVTSELLERARLLTDFRKGITIPNVFDPSVFDSLSLQIAVQNQELQISLDDFLCAKARGGPVIGAVGLIRYKKGYSVLLKAFESILVAYPKAILLVVGDALTPKEKLFWLKQIKEYGLTRHIFLTGRVPHRQVGAWMREMDIFVLPSLYEGSPNALLEAMGCGLPVVASHIDGAVSLIEDHVDGILVSPGSDEDLAQKLNMLIENESLRSQLSKMAKHKIQMHFSPAQETKTWIKAYESVLEI